ncbi:MAG TPA: hypothetical protein VJU17_08835 [Gemmatimonadales bacterium]|nr:hypothetical protein [Gemmatimonadales bacterium]
MASIAVVLIALAGWTVSLAAQWPAQVSAGTRVQVRLPEAQYQVGPRGQLLRGRITGLAEDTLYLAVADSVGPLAIPRAFVQRLEISRGAPSRGVSALLGGLIGGAFGAATFYLVTVISPNGGDSGDAALMGGAIGLGLGGLSGALWPQERWKRVRSGF